MTEAVQEREGLQLSRAPAVPSSPGERLARLPAGWRVADTLVALGVLAAVLVGGNLDTMPRGLEEFLAIRLSLKNVVLLAAFGLAWPSVLSLCGLYAPERLREGKGEWPRLALASAFGCVLAMAFPLTSRSGAVRPEDALFFALAVAPATAVLRAAVRAGHRASRGTRRRQIVLVGSGPLAARVYEELQSDPLHENEVIGFVDSEPNLALGAAGPARLGGVADLERILMQRVVDAVFIGLPIKSRYEEIQQALTACGRVGVPAKYPADLFRSALGVPLVDGRVAAPALSLLVAPDDYRLVIKRGMDIAGAALLLVLLAPVMLAVALMVKLTSPGPALFAHERYGFMKRRFRMLKFRTMVEDAEGQQAGLEQRNEAAGPVFKIRDDPRITPIGRFLRRSSLDELPQLWHVLTGEMSLVGPRPLPIRDVGRFPEPWLMRRFSVKSGLTCLWQINGRSEVGFDHWIALDLEYIDRWSLWLDLEILLRTFPAVCRGTGAR